jgi:hypothetical protein
MAGCESVERSALYWNRVLRLGDERGSARGGGGVHAAHVARPQLLQLGDGRGSARCGGGVHARFKLKLTVVVVARFKFKFKFKFKT